MSYIKKEPLCAWLSNIGVSENIIKAIEDDSRFPPADVVEVVRCKDCKHCDKYTKWNNKEYLGCNWNGEIYEVEAEHYCS